MSVLFLAAIAVASKVAIFTLPIFETKQGSAEQLPAGLCVLPYGAIRGDWVGVSECNFSDFEGSGFASHLTRNKRI